MIVKDALDVARQWVLEEAGSIPGFYGAFSAGSINWLPDDATLPATSDLDMMVVLADSNPPMKLGKFVCRGVLLEVSYLGSEQFQSPDLILGDYHKAGSFKTANIMLDPSGQLTKLQMAVAKQYAKRDWVRKRCAHAKGNVLRNANALSESDPFHDQVAVWLFAAGIMTHILLVAGLKNPTVRRRYLAVQELLAAYGHLDFYQTLLGPLGCTQMSRERVEHHLAALTDVFDGATAVIKTPFFFASDISHAARPIAIDGSRELIEQGYHREAVFWIVATYSRCLKVLHRDAPVELQDRFIVGYQDLLCDLGITPFTDLQLRMQQVKGLLPQVEDVAEAIMAAHPDIVD